MRHKIAVAADSTCDLPASLAAEKDIYIIPQHIVWDNQVYRDGLDLTANEFYQQLAVSPTLPETQTPSVETFAAAYEQIRAANESEQLVIFTLSSRLSPSFHHALEAARLVDFPVFVQDTQAISMAAGFAVLAAAAVREQDGSVEAVLEAARQTRRQTRLYITVSALDFLHRGHRIGDLQHLIGTALGLKPILHLVDGQIEVMETALSHARAVHRLLDLAVQSSEPGQSHLALLEGNAAETALELLAPLRQRIKPRRIIESQVCPAIGVHTGPGVLAIAVS